MCFPSDIQLQSLIDIAKNRATSLIRFTGIEKRNKHLSNNVDLPLLEHNNPEETHVQDNDISVSVSKMYEVTYEDHLDETGVRDSISEAAHLVEDHQRLESQLAALELNSEETENHNASASRISIANLLNVDGQSYYTVLINHRLGSDDTFFIVLNQLLIWWYLILCFKLLCQVSSPYVSKTRFDSITEKAVSLLDESQDLKPEVLVLIRERHDSEAAKGKGNEQKKKNNDQDPAASDHTDPSGATKLDPRTCSKLVAVMLKNSEQMDKALDRLHRWNIHVKLDLNLIAKNTSTTLDIVTQTLYTRGNVSEDNPLEVNKFVVVIKNNVRHPPFDYMKLPNLII